jgi:hypothetical protein
MISPGPPVYSTNKTDRHDIAEILLTVSLNTLTLTIYIYIVMINGEIDPITNPL